MAEIKKRPTLGFLIDWSEQEYQANLRDGVLDAAEKNDANLICFIGGALHSGNQFEAQRNVLFDLVDKKNVDGLIIMSASIGHYISIQDIIDFCDSFSEIPIMSIALELPNHYSILVNQEKGMRDLVCHLLEQHKCKEFAFISGPAENLESKTRYRIFKEVLQEHGMSLHPENYVAGDFMMASGVKAVKTLLDDRKVNFDCVVVASDDMALGVISELQARDIQVPKEVMVVGFDDLLEGRYYSPALTTVHQPFYEQGVKATETMLAILRGEDVPKKIFLDTEVKIRESCGCLSKAIQNVSSGPYQIYEFAGIDQLFSDKEKIVKLILQGIQPSARTMKIVDKKMLLEAVTAFYEEIALSKEGNFLSVISDFVYATMKRGDDLVPWQMVVSIFRIIALPYLVDKKNRHLAEDIWHKARVMIGNMTQRRETLRRMNAAIESQILKDLSEELNTRIGVEELLDVLTKDIPIMGIPSVFVALYDDVKIPGEYSRLILAVDQKKRIKLNADGVRFPSRELFPRNIIKLDRRYTFIVQALFFGTHQLGFTLFEIGLKEGRIYETLRLRISSSLRGGLLLRQVQNQAHLLEEQVKERTRDLVKTNEQLENEIAQRERIENALRRSNEDLQQFAYVASHDLQEPLRMVASYVCRLERRYKDQLDQDANEFIEFVVDGARRMQRMINDLLMFSRIDTQGKEFSETNIANVLQDVLLDLQTSIQEKNVTINIPSHLPVIMADKGQIHKVFQNLISNAMKFQREVPPEITVVFEPRPEEWYFAVQDNGIGIEEEFLDKIFIMFRRLHSRGEYPGTGIGLAIVKKIIERHNGKIGVQSRINEGSNFYFTIPKDIGGANV
ncbi:MAG: substrate-binding domain-containing protein [Spirochaetales bacterium]|nr:substrate-binding domain-containing protein [Spirochaetales bacterium]